MSTSNLKQFRTDQSGSVAIIFALLVTVLFGALALSVDMARAFSAQSRLTTILDAASLAGAKELDSGKSDAEVLASVQVYFNNAMALARHSAATWDLSVQIDRVNSVVNTSVKSSMPTTFGRALGLDTIRLDRASTVNFKTRDIEFAMALDVTGSMAADNKIVDLRTAAADVITTLLDQSKTEDSVRISLVPWSASVNAGIYAGPASGYQSADQCVVERIGANEATDAAPYGPDVVRALTSPPTTYNCPVDTVVPLAGKSRQSQLLNAVANLQPVGGTAGHIGTAWGWYTLAPSWDGIWPSASRPRSYSPRNVMKAIMIMTDGEFNMSWKTSTVYEPVSMGAESYATFNALCTAMKSKDINIYVVGLKVTQPDAVQKMRDCATSPDYFFEAANGSDLKKAFKDIAGKLLSLRISG